MAANTKREGNKNEAWHALGYEDCLDRLDGDREGLTQDQVAERQEKFGPNKLPEKKLDSVLIVFLKQFRDPLIYVLLFAGAVSLAIQHWSDAIFIFAVLAFNATLGTIQEYKAQISAQSLQGVIQKTARVIRAGKKRQINAEELVPGDIVAVTSGDAVPADIRLADEDELRVDESLLTGESEQVDKDSETELAEDTPLGDRDNMLYAGTTVTSGRGRGVVCATGGRTEVGQIARSLTEESEDPPLVQRMRRLTRLIAVFIVVAVLALGAAQIAAGSSWGETFLLAVALAVSAIPAGLPVAVTVALSVASYRMARQQVIIRQLPAVEGLGSCTEICSDKTGTLTENRLTVKCFALLDEGVFDLTGEGLETEGELRKGDSDEPPPDKSGERIAEAIGSAVLANEAEIEKGEDGSLETQGDTLDVAFLIAGRKLDIRRESLIEEDGREQVGEIPYSSERKFAASFNRRGDEIHAHVKGAAETIAEMCAEDQRDAIHREAQKLAAEGYRVLAVAGGPVKDENAAKEGEESALENLEFQALVGLIDPLRPEVPDAVDACHDAGVDVRMVTGDHPDTAIAIGRKLGIAKEDEESVTGPELIEAVGEERSEKEHGKASDTIDRSHVFARIEPHQKTRLVEYLQDRGAFVAVTGDGVNDAPALNAAHISVAMGKGGTDVARRTAQLILGDDNFASIVKGIEQGRIAYDNVRKVVWLLISTSVAELTLFALALASGLPLPLFAAQLLWLNLVTNGIQDVALAFERGEPGVLKRRPRRPDEPIFNRRMMEQVLLSGAWIGVVSYGVFYYLIQHVGMGTDEARNIILLLMVLFENIHIFNCRSEERSAFKVPLSGNWLLIITVVLAQGVHIASMYIPGLSDVLGTQPVSLETWSVLLLITLSVIVVVEAYKAIRKRSAHES
ncbi:MULTISPECIES: HAD-IC family P-type ATPase [unclassified Wenzhouxiangella]|uniref:cation-translocating P-type ATPase n=1 Tax=unclassified Wenzhouxiangella TaxID=2613841 RepID=UPI000E3298F5|nr:MULTISPECIES: HAD-IC family P-type ATPase [unclassified Wenzhouxiangella]RFF26857.1 HAD family hydrolase [Wenzhouxiangella sp. 15181]RFP68489.1 HAD family hydrolase [Wenzhouxiangella sp. 15190]